MQLPLPLHVTLSLSTRQTLVHEGPAADTSHTLHAGPAQYPLYASKLHVHVRSGLHVPWPEQVTFA